MVINILTLSQFLNFDIQARRGHQNAGGGMSSLMNAAESVLSNRYKVRFVTDISQLTSDFVIVDATFFSRLSSEGSFQYEELIREFTASKHANPERKFLLWCAEKTLLRIPQVVRKEILSCIDALAVTCPYIENLFKAINVVPIGLLCDCINPDVFRPAEKELSVIAVGALKHSKNIDWILEIYERLEGKGIQRIYLGSAALWSSENRMEDQVLIEKIQTVTDTYIPNASIVEVAYYNAHAAFAVNNTWHDCSSRANEELLMSGVISLHGEHPLFNGRPGFKVKTPQDAVEKISELTQGFTQLPDPTLHKESREWALANVSEEIFLEQFEKLVRCIL